MDKIITRIPKQKGRNLNAYNYELTSGSNEDDIPLYDDLNDINSNNNDNSNERGKIPESNELGCVDVKQEISNQKDTIRNTNALLIENYSEVLIQKLRLLNSNNTKLRYYYSSGI